MKVATVVVTYNRKNLLRECLTSLLNQTQRPDEIIVVDNASTDGTEHVVCSEFPGITYIKLPQNIGGAGGFSEGTQFAVSRYYEWVWLMDDDGLPAPECLSVLLNYGDDELKIRAPLVLRKDDPERRLAFGLVYKGKVLQRESDALEVSEDGFLEGVANPFNGVLVHRNVFETVGFPKREFFLWGDDVEFLLRASRCGFKYGVITRAIFFHPPNRMSYEIVRLGILRFSVYHTGDDFRDFLIIRNKAYILWRYYGFVAYIKHIAKYFSFYTFRYSLRKGMWAARVAIKGLLGDFKVPTNGISD